MSKKYLFAILLGGKIKKDSLMEDHHLVFIVAKDEKEARELAKGRWQANDLHIDGIQKIEIIDGYEINLQVVKTA